MSPMPAIARLTGGMFGKEMIRSHEGNLVKEGDIAE
jgi:hypothetical protein